MTTRTTIEGWADRGGAELLRVTKAIFTMPALLAFPIWGVTILLVAPFVAVFSVIGGAAITLSEAPYRR